MNFNNDEQKFFSCMGAGVGFIILIVAASIWRGFVIKWLWFWFVSSVFDIQQISIATAIGLTLVVGVLVPSKAQDKKEERDWITVAATSFFVPLALLGTGWVVQMWM